MKKFQLLIGLLVVIGVEGVCASEVDFPSSKSYNKTVQHLKTVHRLYLIAQSEDGRQSPADSVCSSDDSFSPKADRHEKLRAGKRKETQKSAILNS